MVLELNYLTPKKTVCLYNVAFSKRFIQLTEPGPGNLNVRVGHRDHTLFVWLRELRHAKRISMTVLLCAAKDRYKLRRRHCERLVKGIAFTMCRYGPAAEGLGDNFEMVR